MHREPADRCIPRRLTGWRNRAELELLRIRYRSHAEAEQRLLHDHSKIRAIVQAKYESHRKT
jgi:hypothetical protein